MIVGTHTLDDDGYCENHRTFCVVKGMLNDTELPIFIASADWAHSPAVEDLK